MMKDKKPNKIEKILVLITFGLLLGAWSYTRQPDPCVGKGTSVVVLADLHQIHLCYKDQTSKSLRVSLGRGGMGKMSVGDLKTPLGTYPIGRPRESSEFHTFIPIGYPTAAQKKHGYTGSDIGIHGPPRSIYGTPTAYIDWTQGCLALAYDSFIQEVAEWVVTNKPKLIHILD